eukprot:gb/GFBE01050570.1/.p1 GENE.gb/GFBE01050570.1/~~gb/GFBE01050570.1/.p1  ORF type:complete len:421 (+),score=66.83 gb/GFBE01050570.1/:1-1263(+)
MVTLLETLRLVTLALGCLLVDCEKSSDPWYLRETHAPCLWGEEFTTDEPGSSHGYSTCGLRQLRPLKWDVEGRTPCVVYSFGCDGEYSFERSIAAIHGANCEIHIFDPLEPGVPIEDALADLDVKAFFHQTSLLDFDGQALLKPWNHMGEVSSETKTLTTIMEELGHSHIDVLKIDIEGHEHRVFSHLAEVGWPSMPGQVYLEVHKAPGFHRYDEQYVDRLISTLERADLQLFKAERPPRWCQASCVQLSFIHRDWRPEPGPYPAAGGWLKQEYYISHDWAAIKYHVYGNSTDTSAADVREMFHLSRPGGAYPAVRPGSAFNAMWMAENTGFATLLKGCCNLQRVRGWREDWIRSIKLVGTQGKESVPLGDVEPGGFVVFLIEVDVPRDAPRGFHASRWQMQTVGGTAVGQAMEVAVRVL